MKPLYKIAIIVGITILVGAIVFFIWNSFVDTASPEPGSELPVSTGGETGTSSLPVGEGGVKEPGEAGNPPAGGEGAVLTARKISEYPVFDFSVSQDTKEVMYLGLDGKVFGAKEGPDVEILGQTIDALNAIVPSPKGERVLASFGNPLSPQWGVFDTIDKVWRPLPRDVRNAAWGASDSELLAISELNGKKSLVSVDFSKTPFAYKTLLKSFSFEDVVLSFRAPNELLFWERTSAAYPGRLWQLDLKTARLSLLSSLQNGFWLDWSRKGNLGFLYTTRDGFSIIDRNMREIVPLFFSTFPNKCVANSTSTAYCFVPKAATLSNAVLPDDYLQNKLFTVDDLYYLDLEADSVEKVMEGGGGLPAIDAYSMGVTDGALYFLNRYDNGLYEIVLPSKNNTP